MGVENDNRSFTLSCFFAQKGELNQEQKPGTHVSKLGSQTSPNIPKGPPRPTNWPLKKPIPRFGGRASWPPCILVVELQMEFAKLPCPTR